MEHSKQNMVQLKLAGNAQHSGHTVEAAVRQVCRQGLIIEMASPFISRQHIMMATPDGDNCRLEVVFINSDLPDKTAQVLRLDKETDENSGQTWFVVELAYDAAVPRPKHWTPFKRK